VDDSLFLFLLSLARPVYICVCFTGSLSSLNFQAAPWQALQTLPLWAVDENQMGDLQERNVIELDVTVRQAEVEAALAQRHVALHPVLLRDAPREPFHRPELSTRVLERHLRLQEMFNRIIVVLNHVRLSAGAVQRGHRGRRHVHHHDSFASTTTAQSSVSAIQYVPFSLEKYCRVHEFVVKLTLHILFRFKKKHHPRFFFGSDQAGGDLA
jgi:hypothetical protein